MPIASPQMAESDIKELVREAVAKHMDVPVAKVTDAAKLIEDLGGDSLTSIELVMDFEEKFEIEITDDEAHNLMTIADVAKLVSRKLETANEA